MPKPPTAGKTTGFYLDTSEFILDFHKLVKDQIPGWGSQGVKIACAEIIRDTMRDEPTVPKLSGHLRRSGVIEEPYLTPKEIRIVVGFNTEYAARIHEAPESWNWSLPGSGPKFLEKKLLKHGQKYFNIVVSHIKKGKGP